MVDWSLARQIARFAAGDSSVASTDFDLAALSVDVQGPVAGYTGLRPPDPLPAAEVLDRRAWAEVNVGTMAGLLEPVTERISTRLESGGPLVGPMKTVTGAALAAEVGLVIGYMSQRVLGQFELSLLQPEAPARLLFVGPNLDRAVEQMQVDRDSFLTWIVLHEVTHVFEFSGVPWLRGHLGALIREFLTTVEVRVERGAGGGLPSLPDAKRIAETFREGGLAALVQTREQRDVMERVQATMAVVEGYSEHVMDAVGEHVVASYAGLREAMEKRRRNRSAPERALQRLLGFDLKMRQYELGKQFCDGAVQLAGVAGLNQVWEHPDRLPTLVELERPGEWLARLQRERALPAGAAGALPESS